MLIILPYLYQAFKCDAAYVHLRSYDIYDKYFSTIITFPFELFPERLYLYLSNFSYDTTCLASNVWKFFHNTHMFWTHLSFFLILRIIIYPLFAAASHTRWYLLNVLPFIRNDTCQLLLFMSKLTVGFHITPCNIMTCLVNCCPSNSKRLINCFSQWCNYYFVSRNNLPWWNLL